MPAVGRKFDMTLRYSIIVILILVFLPAIGQDRREMCQRVLNRNKIDKSFVFDKSTKADGQNITTFKYLGLVKASNGRIYKFMTEGFVWGLNSHTSGRILIFNHRNNYVGEYVLSDAFQLPDKLRNGIMFFSNSDAPDCDKGVLTKISVAKGLPKRIFIKCSETSGDVYSFTSEGY